jgi:hypothetical protein
VTYICADAPEPAGNLHIKAEVLDHTENSALEPPTAADDENCAFLETEREEIWRVL